MKKRVGSNKNKHKAKKNYQQAQFEKMVAEYQSAKAELDEMPTGSEAFQAHKKHCDMLFAKAERYFDNTQ